MTQISPSSPSLPHSAHPPAPQMTQILIWLIRISATASVNFNLHPTIYCLLIYTFRWLRQVCVIILKRWSQCDHIVLLLCGNAITGFSCCRPVSPYHPSIAYYRAVVCCPREWYLEVRYTPGNPVTRSKPAIPRPGFSTAVDSLLDDQRQDHLVVSLCLFLQ